MAFEKAPSNGPQSAPPIPTALPALTQTLLPLAVLDELQQSGLLEQLRREAVDLAHRTIVGLQDDSTFKGGKFKGGKFKGGKFKGGKFKGGKFAPSDT